MLNHVRWFLGVRARYSLLLIFGTTLSLIAIGPSGCLPTIPPIILPPSGAFAVTGYLTAPTSHRAQDDGSKLTLSERVFVPGVTVWLHHEDTNTDTQAVRTDLSGRFTFPPQKPGRYVLCWKAKGFVNGCSSEIVNVVDQHVYLGPRSMQIERSGTAQTLFGTVRLADSKLPRTLEPMVNINALAQVRVFDASNAEIVEPAYVNNFGDYIVPLVPAMSKLTLTAGIEKAVASAVVTTGSPASFQKVDLVIPNHPPKLTGLIGDNGAGKHWTASPGEKIEITARGADDDGDKLEYQWILPDGTVAASAPGTASVTYLLPNEQGLYEFTAIAYDNKGGYAKDTLSISTLGVRFSGTVSATDAPVVPGASVEVNGKSVLTDTQGYFQLFVDENPRYVLNIRKPGYALVSKIYDGSLVGGRWTLTRASVTPEDPTRLIDVRNTRRPGDCPGSLSSRLDRGDKYQRRTQRKKECGPGIRVRIPPSSLVDADGKPPSGKVEVALSTVDVEAPDGMSGDYTAVDTVGNARVMETYGAGFVEITAGGKSYNLDQSTGATAEVFIPIDPSVFAAGAPIPPTIPVLSYIEPKGIWQEEGIATRVGIEYVAKVKHFSAINMDLLKTNQACLRLEATAMPASFDLEAKVLPPGTTTTKTVHIDNSFRRFHVLYNLPTSQTVDLRAFQAGTTTPIEFLVPPSAAGVPVISVSSIPTQVPTSPNLPEFPYSACQRSVELSPFRLPPPISDSFLHGLYSFAAVNLTELDAATPNSSAPYTAAANAYYNTIDPKKLREDLDEFKAQNGFPGSEVQAYYGNSADLGFGRDMHCRRQAMSGLSGFDVACYVVNYGSRFTPDRDDFIDAVNNTQPIAAVAMEYSRVEKATGSGFFNNNRVVKFYVFKKNVASPVPGHGGGFGRAPSASLDGFGERPVPQLCMVCHGGRYPMNLNAADKGKPAWNTNDPTTANLGSKFIAFDLSGFELPNYQLRDWKADQQGRFKDLNTKMVWEAGSDTVIKEVIEKMYNGVGFPASTQIENFFVSGWSSAAHPGGDVTQPNQQEEYSTVVARSCRTCHLSQGPSPITWHQATQWQGSEGFIGSLVCDNHVMPHSLVTHNRFWLSLNPHQPVRLHDYLNGPASPGTGVGNHCDPSSAP